MRGRSRGTDVCVRKQEAERMRGIRPTVPNGSESKDGICT